MNSQKNSLPQVDFYKYCYQYVQDNDKEWGISWYVNLPNCPTEVKESRLVEEYIWCVLVSGFRARTISNIWDKIKLFTNQFNLSYCVSNPVIVEKALLSVFNNRRKVNNISTGLRYLNHVGSDEWLHKIKNDYNVLQSLPGIGPVVCYHLARNLGVDVAKPDLWLLRMCKWFGYPETHEGVQDFCKSISDITDHRIGQVDGIIWDFCSLIGSENKVRQVVDSYI